METIQHETWVRIGFDVVIIALLVGCSFAYLLKKHYQLKERVDFIYYPKSTINDFDLGAELIIHKVELKKKVAVVEEVRHLNAGVIDPDRRQKIRLCDYTGISKLQKGKRYVIDKADGGFYLCPVKESEFNNTNTKI